MVLGNIRTWQHVFPPRSLVKAIQRFLLNMKDLLDWILDAGLLQVQNGPKMQKLIYRPENQTESLSHPSYKMNWTLLDNCNILFHHNKLLPCSRAYHVILLSRWKEKKTKEKSTNFNSFDFLNFKRVKSDVNNEFSLSKNCQRKDCLTISTSITRIDRGGHFKYLLGKIYAKRLLNILLCFLVPQNFLYLFSKNFLWRPCYIINM